MISQCVRPAPAAPSPAPPLRDPLAARTTLKVTARPLSPLRIARVSIGSRDENRQREIERKREPPRDGGRGARPPASLGMPSVACPAPALTPARCARARGLTVGRPSGRPGRREGAFSAVNCVVEGKWLMHVYIPYNYGGGLGSPIDAYPHIPGRQDILPWVNVMRNGRMLHYYAHTYVPAINFWGAKAFQAVFPGTPDYYFRSSPRLWAATFEGRFDVRAAGAYTFCTNSAKGSDFIVDGALVVDNSGIHTLRKRSPIPPGARASGFEGRAWDVGVCAAAAAMVVGQVRCALIVRYRWAGRGGAGRRRRQVRDGDAGGRLARRLRQLLRLRLVSK
jgi:hypothetical protein